MFWSHRHKNMAFIPELDSALCLRPTLFRKLSEISLSTSECHISSISQCITEKMSMYYISLFKTVIESMVRTTKSLANASYC